MKVVVGLSGGVDSAVAAYLMQKAGHEVIAIFMRNWDNAEPTQEEECPWIEDSNDALLVAERLGIPFQVIDLSKEYKERIVDYMFHEYAKGRTPNPDILCNREVKFDLFLKAALALGAEGVATGHYVQKKESLADDGHNTYHLLSGVDSNKDQSYFLCQLNQEQLAYAHFPIGHMTKPEVRALAKEIGLDNAEKKDSQGLCFIGKVSLPDFLQQQLSPKEGDIVEIPANGVPEMESDLPSPGELFEKSKKRLYAPNMGKVVGKHRGAHFFTKGQRKGLGVGGKTEPLFVLDTDVHQNIIYTGQGKDHPGLYRHLLRLEGEAINWLQQGIQPKEGVSMEVKARIRYRQSLQEAKLIVWEGHTYLWFKEKQFAIAEGQFAAWYIGEELIGSGVIA